MTNPSDKDKERRKQEKDELQQDEDIVEYIEEDSSTVPDDVVDLGQEIEIVDEPTQITPGAKKNPPGQEPPTRRISRSGPETKLAHENVPLEIPDDTLGVNAPDLSIDKPGEEEIIEIVDEASEEILEVIPVPKNEEVLEVDEAILGQEDSSVTLGETDSGSYPDLGSSVLEETRKAVEQGEPIEVSEADLFNDEDEFHPGTIETVGGNAGADFSGIDIVPADLGRRGERPPAARRQTSEEEAEVLFSDEPEIVESSSKGSTNIGEPQEIDIDEIYLEDDLATADKPKAEQSPDDIETTQAFVDGPQKKSVSTAETSDEFVIDDNFLDQPSGDALEVLKEEKSSAGARGKMKSSALENDQIEEIEASESEESKSAKSAKKGKKDKEEEKSTSKKRQKPERKSGGMLAGVTGFAAAFLLLGGAAGGVWYFAPDLIPSSPNSSPPKKEIVYKDKESTPGQQARALIGEGNYDQAITVLGENPQAPEEKALRGEATWLKYFKEQMEKKLPLDANAAPVKQALADTAENPLLQAQMNSILGSQKLQMNLQSALNEINKMQSAMKGAQKNDLAVRDILIKAKLVPGNDQQLQNLPAAVDQLAKYTLKTAQDLASSQNSLQTVAKLLGSKIESAPTKLQEILQKQEALSKQLSVTGKELTASNKEIKELSTAQVKLKNQLMDLEKAAETALQKLNEGKKLPGSLDLKEALVKTAELVSKKAKSPLGDAMGNLVNSLGASSFSSAKWLEGTTKTAGLQTQLGMYQLREPFLESPSQRLDTWIRLFENGVGIDSATLNRALKDARFVMGDQSASNPAGRVKALYLLALVERSKEDFAQGKKSLQEAIRLGSNMKPRPAWLAGAEKLSDQLTNPEAYYLPLVEKLRNDGQNRQAMATLESALKVMPGDPHLLLLRGMTRLDMVNGKTDPALAQKIGMDAKAATKNPSTAAKAYYVLGLLEESLGNFSKAESNYRMAIAVHKGPEGEANLYRIALARLLLREQVLHLEFPRPDLAGGSNSTFEQFQGLLMVALTGVQAPEIPGGKKEDSKETRIAEGMKLANELLKSENPKIKGQGYMLLGEALSRQGKRTEGLETYVKGLKLFYPGIASENLSRLVEDHPAFQVSDSLEQPNPFMAESHFGKGLSYFWDDKYEQAEKEFKQAIEYSKQDARYFYFMALSQLAQKTDNKKESSIFYLEQGARLESQSLPNTVEVNASLERIQGEVRQLLDRFRRKGALNSRR